MLRADNVICGTSTTGTGTLTLAACPAPPGGIDFDKWLKATGFNFVSTNAVLVSYTIIEYTSSAFTTAKSTEKGIGTLTLGASITAATLARTTVQSIATGLDTATPSPTFSAPTAITIGTAANTLVFVGASASDVMAFPPYVETSISDFGIGALGSANPHNFTSNVPAATGTDYYIPFFFPATMRVKKIRTEVKDAYTGGTTNLYAAIYAVGTNGRPSKLLIDFGVLGTAGTSLNSANTNIASAAHATGFLLTPGAYIMRWMGTFTGGSGGPTLYGPNQASVLMPPFFGADGASFSHGFHPLPAATATGGSSTAPDPANTTGYALSSLGTSALVTFALTPN